jgi:hypothetical protein
LTRYEILTKKTDSETVHFFINGIFMKIPSARILQWSPPPSFWIFFVFFAHARDVREAEGHWETDAFGTSCRRVFTETQDFLLECDFTASQGAWYFQTEQTAFVKQADGVAHVLVGTETDDGTTSHSVGLIFFDVRAVLQAAGCLPGRSDDRQRTSPPLVNTTDASVSCVVDGNEGGMRDEAFELRSMKFDWLHVTEDDELAGRITFPTPVCSSPHVFCLQLSVSHAR